MAAKLVPVTFHETCASHVTDAQGQTTQIKSFNNKNAVVALREKEAAVTLQNSRLAGQSCNSFDTLVGLTPEPAEHRHFSDIGNQTKK